MEYDHLKPHIQRLLGFYPGEDLYLTFIQDFLHPLNPEGALRLVGTCEKQKTAERALDSSGQRHPGLVLQIKSTNNKFFSKSILPSIYGLTDYQIHQYDYAVLVHAPSKLLLERFSITAVYAGFKENSRRNAADYILKSPRFALMGQVLFIGDSEHGPYPGIVKTKKDGLIRPIR